MKRNACDLLSLLALTGLLVAALAIWAFLFAMILVV